MKIENYQYPKSSFLSMEKDSAIIIQQIKKNNRLQQLLYYTSADCLQKPVLTDEQFNSMLGDTISFVPKITIDPDVKNYLTITFDDFATNSTNPQFRDNIITFDILCHFNIWNLKDFKLRPYKIAAEIDSMFNNKHLTGIGTLQFLTGKRTIVNPEFGGISLLYYAIHGGEDKINALNGYDEESIIDNFNEMFNNG